jgi:phage regulator Rha-like protein
MNRKIPVQEFVNLQEKMYYSGKILIPFIVTSKKIVRPIIDKKDNIIDIEEVKFLLYEHSVLIPNKYFELLGNFYDIAIFICNENYFDEFLDYIENVFEKLYNTITANIEKFPIRLIDDFEEMKKHQKEIEIFRKTRN